MRESITARVRLMIALVTVAGLCGPVWASWTADNGNGTYSNPLFYEEFSDPSMIRVGEDFYLTGTTMHCMPGLPVLHSKDLVNWTLASYAFDRLDLGPEFRLEGGEIYGQGIWAPSIRYHDGTFYIFSNVNRYGTQVYRATDPAGPWKHNRLGTRLYDLSVLFDDGGRIYAVHGVDEIHLSQLNSEVTDVVPDTERVIIPRGSGMGEGLHFYKINGLYYIISAIPGAHTPMKCARSKTLDGPYEIITISEKESMGIGLSYRLRETRDGGFQIVPPDINRQGGLTLHQGGIVDTPSGQWWGYSMMDHNAIGRLTCLSPVTWVDGWPYFGLPGNLMRSPRVWVKPDTGWQQDPKPLFERSDDFSDKELKPIWQWNHHPDDSKWSLTERPGFLRLHSLPAEDFWWARNTLTQRAAGPESTATAELDASGMQAGDVAGLALLNRPYAWLGVARTDTGLEIRHYDQFADKALKKPVQSERLWFRACCNFDTDKARFSFSTDGNAFEPIGGEFILTFQLKTFQGVRYSLFHYNASGQAGGVADFDRFTLDEPRDRGLVKPIPYRKTIVLTRLGDGKSLGVKDGKVRAIDETCRFLVVDRGLGRIALRTDDGAHVSVTSDGQVLVRKTDPGQAETFQWVDMQREDIMLMSLVTHRYVCVPPDSDEPANADLAGPRPDRLDGSCFAWKLSAGRQDAGSNSLALTYENPLWSGYLADPFVLRVGDQYYAYGTGLAPDGRQFPILRSEDFAYWEFVGGVLPPLSDPNLKDYWAPEVAERNGKFYLYYAGDMKMRVAMADDPAGPFRDSGRLMFPDLPFSIDGHAFLDPQSGQWYFYFAKDFFDQRPGTALAMVRLADDMITPVGPVTTVLRAFADWQIYERNRPLYDKTWDAWHTIEGAAVVYKDGKYHCFYSGGNWQTPGYGVGCAVADHILGPYVDENSREAAGVLKSIPGKLIGPGHNSVILGPDEQTYFIVYHSWNDDRSARQICMDPLVWTERGPKAYQPSRGRKQVQLPLREKP